MVESSPCQNHRVFTDVDERAVEPPLILRGPLVSPGRKPDNLRRMLLPHRETKLLKLPQTRSCGIERTISVWLIRTSSSHANIASVGMSRGRKRFRQRFRSGR